MEVCYRMNRSGSNNYLLRLNAADAAGPSTSAMTAVSVSSGIAPVPQQPPPNLMTAPLIAAAAANALSAGMPAAQQRVALAGTGGGTAAVAAAVGQPQQTGAATFVLPTDFSNLFHHYQVFFSNSIQNSVR